VSSPCLVPANAAKRRLPGSEADSPAWRKNFIQTFLERDIPQFGIGTPASTLLRFWTMLAHYHGQVWNAAEPARSLGVNESTVRRYLDLLSTEACSFKP